MIIWPKRLQIFEMLPAVCFSDSYLKQSHSILGKKSTSQAKFHQSSIFSKWVAEPRSLRRAGRVTSGRREALACCLFAQQMTQTDERNSVISCRLITTCFCHYFVRLAEHEKCSTSMTETVHEPCTKNDVEMESLCLKRIRSFDGEHNFEWIFILKCWLHICELTVGVQGAVVRSAYLCTHAGMQETM